MAARSSIGGEVSGGLAARGEVDQHRREGAGGAERTRERAALAHRRRSLGRGARQHQVAERGARRLERAQQRHAGGRQRGERRGEARGIHVAYHAAKERQAQSGRVPGRARAGPLQPAAQGEGRGDRGDGKPQARRTQELAHAEQQAGGPRQRLARLAEHLDDLGHHIRHQEQHDRDRDHRHHRRIDEGGEQPAAQRFAVFEIAGEALHHPRQLARFLARGNRRPVHLGELSREAAQRLGQTVAGDHLAPDGGENLAHGAQLGLLDGRGERLRQRQPRRQQARELARGEGKLAAGKTPAPQERRPLGAGRDPVQRERHQSARAQRIPEGGRTSYAGDVLAIVVAEDVATARRAAEAIEVEYNVLPAITDPVVAVSGSEDAVWGLSGNILSTSTYQRGDVDAALGASAHTLHEVFQTQRVEHAFLEPESTLVIPNGDGTIHVYSGGQGVWDDRDQIAAVIGLEKSAVTVELVSNGGAFGGKEDLCNQAQTALASFLLDRPVKCTVTRDQSHLIHAKRHPIRIEVWAGCDAEGRLTAYKARMIGDSGPYASVGMKVLERAAGHATGPYTVPVVDVESVAARTNNSVGGAFRGFGANQAQFAMEGVMDRLAEKVGIDGWEIRRRNVVTPGAIWGPGQIMDDGCKGALICLETIKPHYDQARSEGRPWASVSGSRTQDSATASRNGRRR